MKRSFVTRTLPFCLLMFLFAGRLSADWPQFRGPDGQGHSDQVKDGATDERIAKINSLVRRVRKMLDEEGEKRKRHLVLAARIPSNYGKTPPSYETSRQIGCDPVAWAKNGWVDFLTASEFLHVRYDLPIAPWKKLITEVPIYGSIECTEGRPGSINLTPEQYRRAAQHLWKDGEDGIYLFNFFTAREHQHEPPFEVLEHLDDMGSQP